MLAERASAWWLVVGARAIASVVAGLVVTFSADHSSQFGLIVFGIFALVSGVVLAAGSRMHTALDVRRAQTLLAAASFGGGLIALIVNGAGLGVLVGVLVAFGAVTGIVELVLGLRARGESPWARDWVTTGILGIMLAVAVALIPLDFANNWEIIGKDDSAVSGVVTAEIFVVGILGAYAVVLGVFLLIAAVSARGIAGASPRTKEREPATPSGV